MARSSDRRRAAWLDGYVQRITQRDATDISGLHRVADLPRLLRLLAARTATELNQASVATTTTTTGIPARTLPPYLDLLETLYLIQRIPAWSTNLAKRVIARPKVMLLDSGLAARLINVSPSGAGHAADPTVAGQLIETFTVARSAANSAGPSNRRACTTTASSPAPRSTSYSKPPTSG